MVTKGETVSVAAWATCLSPHLLVRWSRRVGTARKFFALGCAIARHGGAGVQTDLGRRVLDVFDRVAREWPSPVKGVRLGRGVLAVNFPGTFMDGWPYATQEVQRELGADYGWFQAFPGFADPLGRTNKSLPNVLIGRLPGTVAVILGDGGLARTLAAGLVETETDAETGWVRRMWAKPRRLLNRARFRAEVLALLPETMRSFAEYSWPDGRGVENSVRWAERWLATGRTLTTRRAAVGGVCDLVRDVFGDPFRRWACRPEWADANGGAARHIAAHILRTGDHADLPVLADALEDAGCTDEFPLRHCREPGRHVPGCWVVDAVLGR